MSQWDGEVGDRDPNWGDSDVYAGEPTPGTKGSLKKFIRERLATGMDRLQNDPMSLGMSDQDIEEMLAKHQQAGINQQLAQAAQLQQAALAGQGFQAGAFNQAYEDISAQADQNMATASKNVMDANQALIEQNKGMLLSEIYGQIDRKSAAAQFWAQYGMDQAGAAAEALDAAGAFDK